MITPGIVDNDSYDQTSFIGDEEDETAIPDSYIRIQYHPRTGLPDKIINLEFSSQPESIPSPPSHDQYDPFPTYADYIFSEWVTKSNASNADIDFLLRNIHNGTFCSRPLLKIKNAAQLRRIVDKAASIYHNFTPHDYSVKFKKLDGTVTDLQYQIYVKDGEKWIEEMVTDPTLKEDWEWHANRRFIVINGENIGRAITNPMTADSLYQMEELLSHDPSHVQFPLIAYSDKSNAAYWAQSEIWPLCMRPANLPKAIAHQNNSYGGNSLIALFPKIVPPDGEADNPSWPSTLRAVYHKGLETALESFARSSKEGVCVRCGDGVIRVIFPRFPIINQDLQEQYLSALTRGNNALHGCPRCDVHHDDLGDILTSWDLRCQTESEEAYRAALELHATGQKRRAEELLQSKGLYLVRVSGISGIQQSSKLIGLVQNGWWTISNCNVHDALSFDVLHSIWLGVWGKHLWPLLLSTLTPAQKANLRDRAAFAPTFPGMMRLTSLDKVEFSDGKKYFSILQQVLPLVVDLVLPRFHPFLKAIQILSEIAMHSEFRLQLEDRLERGKALVRQLGNQLEVRPNTPEDEG
ncbi:hypothetical protein FRB91_000219 [Serendipita sp. 411]|nr:hypothetical protein FRC18_004867 [Serendipita sp. 400]KAG8847081.1 hypothetical protein FRB91_000219 [Serendipita sp. 411]